MLLDLRSLLESDEIVLLAQTAVVVVSAPEAELILPPVLVVGHPQTFYQNVFAQQFAIAKNAASVEFGFDDTVTRTQVARTAAQLQMRPYRAVMVERVLAPVLEIDVRMDDTVRQARVVRSPAVTMTGQPADRASRESQVPAADAGMLMGDASVLTSGSRGGLLRRADEELIELGII